MPYVTDFYGSLITDKPIPPNVQQYLEFLSDIDLRSLTSPRGQAVANQLPDGFPAEAFAQLVDKGIYRIHLYAESDTELSPVQQEYTELSVASVQLIIDEFLKPLGIKATGRIEAAGESGVGDLWAIVVGDDQIVHDYEGTVIYQDQPGYPLNTHAADTPHHDAHAQPAPLLDPIHRLGLWLCTNAQLPDDCSHADVDDLINALSSSSVPDSLSAVSSQLSPSSFCEECGAEAEPTFESAPGDFHDPSCSLHTADPE